MLGSIVVVGVLTCPALFHSVGDLKAVQMNVQHSLIQEFMLYKFELDHSNTETSKNIWRYSWSQYNNQMAQKNFTQVAIILRIREGHIDLKAWILRLIQVIESNLVSSTWRISDRLGILQPSVVHHLHNLSKSINKSCQIVPQVIKILQNLIHPSN